MTNLSTSGVLLLAVCFLVTDGVETSEEALLTPDWPCLKVGIEAFECVHTYNHDQKKCVDLVLGYETCVKSDDTRAGSLLDDPGYTGYYRLRRCRYGFMLYNPFDVYVGLGLEMYGEWSQTEMDFMVDFIEPGHTVLDVGTHIGSLTTAFASAVGPTGMVLGFEPQHALFQIATANIALNNYNHARIYNAFVGEIEREQYLEDRVYNSFSNFGTDMRGDEKKRGQYINVMTIDGLQLPNCDFIKIDVEGMEMVVLQGAEATLQFYAPTIYFEDNNISPDPNYRPQEVQFLQERGYECYLDHRPYYNEDNYRMEPRNIFAYAATGTLYSKMIMCVHPGRYPNHAQKIHWRAPIPNPHTANPSSTAGEL